MSLSLLKQDAEILLEVAVNYEKLLEARKNAEKNDIEKFDISIKNFKTQFLYLLTSINKKIEQEKNAR